MAELDFSCRCVLNDQQQQRQGQQQNWLVSIEAKISRRRETKFLMWFFILTGLLFPRHLARAGFSTISNKEEGC